MCALAAGPLLTSLAKCEVPGRRLEAARAGGRAAGGQRWEGRGVDLTLAQSPNAEAEGVSPIVIGSVIRVSAPSMATGPIQGTLVEIDDQALLISG